MVSAEPALGPGEEGEYGERRRFRLGLRTGFLLVVLLGAIVPLGLLGVWLVQRTERSAESLVRARLAETLDGVVTSVARSWTRTRADLLRLAETGAVQAGLRDPEGPILPVALRGARSEGPAPGPAGNAGEIARVWEEMDGVERVVFRDATGAQRGILERESEEPEGPGAAVSEARVPVRVGIHEPVSGERLGTLEAWLRAGVLLPGDVLLPGASGSMLALFEPTEGRSLLPLPLDPELFADRRFEWRGERWAVAHRRLYEPPLVLALAGPVAPVAAPLREATRHGTLALLGVTLIAVAVTVLVSRRLTRPLAALVEAADDVAAGRLDRRAPEKGPAEVHRLGRAFNEMTASLRRTLERLSQHEALAAMGEMAASLAHEVRNPLMAIRLDLERARRRIADGGETERETDGEVRELLERALGQVGRLQGSVDDALRLTRSGRADREPVELSAPLRAAADAAEPHFAERGARLEAPAELGEGIRMRGDPALLEQLFLNLLVNAAEALPSGGRAGIRVEREPDDAEGIAAGVRVVVWDEGPGMPPEVRERVMEPFFSTKAEGTGLGLPIAGRITRTLGGELRIESEPGEGTTVTVRLPRDRSES